MVKIRAMMLRLFLALFIFTVPALGEELSGIDALDGADVVLLGEVHDNPDHHLFQIRY